MKVSKHIFFYKGEESLIPAFGLCSGNTYIIRGDRLTLVDPGPSMGPHLRRVRRGMSDDGLRYDNISKIIVTHAHPDHAQALPALQERLVNTQVYCHPLEKRILENPDLMWDDEYELLGPFAAQVMPLPRSLMVFFERLMFGTVKPFYGAITVGDGAMLNLGVQARIVGLPGHRPGEIGIHIPEDNALIIGDLVNYRMYDVPSLNMPVSDLKQAEESVKKIRAMDIKILAPAHNEVVFGEQKINEWLDDTLERCKLMRRQAEKSLLDNPRIPLQLLGKTLCGRNEGMTFFHRRLIAHVVLKALAPVEE
jgi:glyoxylase-like metal-dependent hydrolase (beta-lactamase superfamily II)